MPKTLTLFLIFIFTYPALNAQQRDKFVSAEVGFLVMDGILRADEDIRTETTQPNVKLRGGYSSSSCGAKFEIFTHSKKFSLSGGIQYALLDYDISIRSYGLLQPDFFYYRFRESSTTTEYLKVRAISQKVHAASIPIDVRIFPFDGRRFKAYFKGGVDVNFKMKSESDVSFVNPQMALYEEELLKHFQAPENVSVILNIGAGARYKIGRPILGAEVSGPSFYLTENSGGMVRPTAGAGFQIHVSYPLNNNEAAE